MRKGEESEVVVYWNWVPVKNAEQKEDEEVLMKPVLRYERLSFSKKRWTRNGFCFNGDKGTAGTGISQRVSISELFYV